VGRRNDRVGGGGLSGKVLGAFDVDGGCRASRQAAAAGK